MNRQHTRILAIAAVFLPIFNPRPVAEEFTAVETSLAKTANAKHYLFSYFKGNGEDGLHLAHSNDGLHWKALNQDRSFLKPKVGGKLMRDPCICQGPDGRFHMVWTTGWWEKNIGIAHSDDLVHWSEQKTIPVMEHEPTARNSWAPEIFYDAPTEQYLICWSTTIPGRFPETESSGDGGLNHRIYYTTTKDFVTYAETKLLYDDGFNVIDATIVQDGARYVMFIKDETKQPVAKKNIRIATANRAEGPYGPATAPFSVDWVEGPTAIKIGQAWHVYYDAYTRGHFDAMRSKDLVAWESLKDEITFPEGARHGTVFAVSKSVIAQLQKH